MSTQLSLTEPQERPSLPSAPNDTRDAVMGTPSTLLPAKLAEFSERRRIFREWLEGQLTLGVHYGKVAESKKSRTDEQRKEYRDRRNLLQPGADFIVEVMGVSTKFEECVEGTKQAAGTTGGATVWRCLLISRSGEVVGEGLGAARCGASDFDLNKGVKMACKRAKVAAVLNTYGLSDMFTQDMEEGPPPATENPKASETPKTQPRGERVIPQQCKALLTEWQEWRQRHGKTDDRSDFEAWVSQVTGMPIYDTPYPGRWTLAGLNQCLAAIGGGA